MHRRLDFFCSLKFIQRASINLPSSYPLYQQRFFLASALMVSNGQRSSYTIYTTKQGDHRPVQEQPSVFESQPAQSKALLQSFADVKGPVVVRPALCLRLDAAIRLC